VVIIEPGAIRTEWGQIAVDKAIAVSGHTAYGTQARAVSAMLNRTMERFGARPQVIADAVVRAATARHPRARYVAPAMMRIPLLLLPFAPDRLADAIMVRVFGTGGRAPATSPVLPDRR